MSISKHNIYLLIAALSVCTFATPLNAPPNSSLAESRPVKCGERLKEPLYPSHILIDTGSEIEQWPWVGALFINFENSPEFQCVVTILSDRFVVSGGYWARAINLKPSELSVRLGAASLIEDKSGSLQTFAVEEFHISNEVQRFATIALLKLSSKIAFSQFVHSICLKDVSPDEFIIGSNGITVGWETDLYQGYDNFFCDKYMRESSVSVVSNCNCIVPKMRRFSMKGKLCAKVAKRRPKELTGTHAGGLYLEDNGTWYLKGVVVGMMDEQHFVFSDIASNLPWIRKTIN